MKRILFLLLLTVSVYGQNPSRFAKIQITGNSNSGTATKVNVQEANGEVNTQAINTGFNKNIGLGGSDVVGATALLNQYSTTPVDWTATAFNSGQVVFYGGKQWIAKIATVAGDVPAVSSKWEEITFEALANKTTTVDQTIIDGSTNAVSSNAVFDALATKANDSDVVKLTGNETKTGNLLLDGNFSATEGIGGDILVINSNADTNSRIYKMQQETDGVFKLQKSTTNVGGLWNDLLTFGTDDVAIFENTVRAQPATDIADLATYGQVLKGNVLTVAKSGGQYATIDSALQFAIINSTIYNPITIVVHPGIYEEFLQIPPDKFITISGINRNTCVLVDKSGDYYQAPISMAGNVVIENMTIIASKENITTPAPALPSYAIHHDSTGEGKSYIRNCNIISYNNCAIGIGLQNNQQLTIDNCYMYSTANPALLMHPDPLAGATNQKLVVNNSVMASTTDKAIALIDSNNTGSGAGDNRDTELAFTNNTLYSTTTGIADLFYGTAPMGFGSFGYMLLKAESGGNTIDNLNKVKIAVDSDVLHKAGNETKTGSLLLSGESAFTAKIHAANGNGGDFRNLFGDNPSSRTYRTTTDVNAYGDWALQKEQTKGGNDFINVINVNPLGQIVATAPTLPVGSDTNDLATTAFVLANSSARPYKVYTALLSQIGNAAPTATVLENTLGGTVVWSRTGTGVYTATLNGAFPLGKTTVMPFFGTLNGGVNLSQTISGVRIDNNSVGIRTSAGSTLTDVLLLDATIEIRIYN